MLHNFFDISIVSKIGHKPTTGQTLAIKNLLSFIEHKDKFCMFLLKGYAGTGKTTLISALINTLDAIKINTLLMAPTGRAAKVLTSYSGKPAYTIHKCIYRKKSTKSADSSFGLNFNKYQDTIFIVDEASMIGNSNLSGSAFGSGRLLEDLLSFVFNDNNCRLILVGDTAQLPPVGTLLSPALDKAYLESLDMTVFESELFEVVRQNQDSGILDNATRLRKNLLEIETPLPTILGNYKDVVFLNGAELLDELENCYSKFGEDETKVICRSNKTAGKYNVGIRSRILWKEEEISRGDLLMVVKNSYSWLPENEAIDFIANGDIVQVLRVGRKQEIYGHNYVDLSIRFVDYPEIETEVKAILNTLTSDLPAMETDYYKNLYSQLQEDYSDISDSKKRHEAILADPFFNALQIKFAYAITCHKAQGGQWKAVFLDHGYIKPEELKPEDKYAFTRWLYTGLTRATEKIYLVNWDKSFSEQGI